MDAQAHRAALAARYLNQDEADAKAMKLCGQGCEVVLRFEGAGTFGVVARSEDGSIVVGSSANAAQATDKAMVQCSAGGAQDCVVVLEGCDD